MDVVVKGRNVEVPEHFRTHVSEKLAKAEKYDPKIIRVDVELSHEANPRQAKVRQRVQITLLSKGPVVRSEASSDSFYTALDGAVDRLETQLKRAAGRRRDRYHKASGPVPVEVLTDQSPKDDEPYPIEEHLPGQIVRVKDHPAEPITVDQALYQMELVGHDFYLFKDAQTRQACVVYRRKGYDYGLIRLAEDAQ